MQPASPRLLASMRKARGAMARFVMQNKITATTELMEFDSGGYAYEPALSDEQTLYFTR